MIFFIALLFFGTGCATSSGNLYNNIRKTEEIKTRPEKKEESPPQGDTENSHSGKTEEKKPEEDSPVLKITSWPPAADVYLDGSYLGSTPVSVKNPEEGSHFIELKKEGYHPATDDFSYEGGRKTLYFSLQKIFLFSIYTSPSGSDVYINGNYTGKSPIVLEEPEEGSYEIRVTRPGYLTNTQSVRYEGDDREINIKLEPGNILFITSVPTGANVIIDDIHRGKTPYEYAEPDSGFHSIRLEKPAYYPVETTVICNGTTQRVNWTLILITGYLELSTAHPGLIVYLDGKPIAPGKQKIAIGGHQLSTQKLFGFEDYKQSINIEENQTTTVDIKLTETAFGLISLDQNRTWFDPMSPAAATVEIKFEVSAPCLADFMIIDSNGKVVWSENDAQIRQAEYGFHWNGYTESGIPVSDGLYRYTLKLRHNGQEPGLNREGTVEVRRDQVHIHSTAFSGVNGLLYTGSPFTLAKGVLLSQIIVMGHTTENPDTGTYYIERVPAALSFTYGLLSYLQMTIEGALINEDSDIIPKYLSGSLNFRFLSKRLGLMLISSSFSVKGAYHYGTPTDTLTNFTGVSAGLPIAFKISDLQFLLHPEIILSPWQISYDSSSLGYLEDTAFYSWLYFRGGLLLDLHYLKLGVSTAIRTTPLQEGFQIATPFQLGYEVSFSPPIESFTISIYIAGEIESLSSYYYMGGAGLSLAF